MNDQEKSFGENKFNKLPEGQSDSAEILPEVKSSFLSDVIGGESFISDEVNLRNEDKKDGVVLTSDGHDNEFFVFDKDVLDTREKLLLKEFVQLVKEKGKEGIKTSVFGWFFEEESEEFIRSLADKLETRIEEIEEGFENSQFSNLQIDDDPLIQAVQSFREMAKRNQLKETLDKQVQDLPLIGFQGRKKDGSFVDIPYDKKDWKSHKNGIDYMLVKRPDGKSELVITCKNDEFDLIVPIYVDSDEEQQFSGFGRVGGTGEKASRTIDPQTNRDTSSVNFDIHRGNAKVDPLFTSVRVMLKPMDLDKELDDYLRQRKEEEEREAEKRRRQQSQSRPTNTYTPTPPSVPSTSRYSQPTTYVRSG